MPVAWSDEKLILLYCPVGVRTHDLPHTAASNMVKVYQASNHSATAAVDAIDAHVTFQSVKPSHLWTSSGSGSRHLRTECASCYVGLLPSHHVPIP